MNTRSPVRMCPASKSGRVRRLPPAFLWLGAAAFLPVLAFLSSCSLVTGGPGAGLQAGSYRSFRMPGSGVGVYYRPADRTFETLERAYFPDPAYPAADFEKDMTVLLRSVDRVPQDYQVVLLQDGRMRITPPGLPVDPAAGASSPGELEPIRPTYVHSESFSYEPDAPRTFNPGPVAPAWTTGPQLQAVAAPARIFRDRRGIVYVYDRRSQLWQSKPGAYQFSAGSNPFLFASELTRELRRDGKIPSDHRVQVLGDGRVRVVLDTSA